MHFTLGTDGDAPDKEVENRKPVTQLRRVELAIKAQVAQGCIAQEIDNGMRNLGRILSTPKTLFHCVISRNSNCAPYNSFDVPHHPHYHGFKTPPNCSYHAAMAPTPAAADVTPSVKEDSRTRFLRCFPSLVDELIADLRENYDLSEESVAYIRHNIEYNVPKGKLNRGMAVRRCYEAFADSPSDKSLEQADVLGWCVELLQGYFLVADDIMDASVTRRGQPCWYQKKEIGLNAINDAMMLEAMIFRLLRRKFKKEAAYVHLVELFLDITYTTEIGQLLDLTSPGPPGTTASDSLKRFDDAMLARIYRYKTSHYSFYLPCALGMRLAGVSDTNKFEVARAICLDMGYYFQAQDDFLDCFGDPQITGKVGTDIEDNTCTWLVVQALKKVTPEQRQLLIDNYGKKEIEYVQIVKNLYEDLGLKKHFADFEQSSYDAISRKIDAVDDMPTDAFRFLLAKIYKRDK